MPKCLFLRFPDGKAKAVTLSYDDGVDQDIRLIEIMKKYGLKGTFNLNSGKFAPEGTEYPQDKVLGRRMTASQAKELYSNDLCEVACHGVTHPFLDACDSAVAMGEVVYDRRNLEKMFGCQVHGMAYPYGTYNDKVVEIFDSAGIYYSRTVTATLDFNMPSDWLRMPATCHHNNPKLNELTDKFISLDVKYRHPKLFYLWGHSYEFDVNNNWNVIEEFAQKIHGKEDIWYATNIEIYRAWRDFKRLKISADGSIIYNPNSNDVWCADESGTVHCIKSGETVRW